MSSGILEFELSEKEWLELVRQSKGIVEVQGPLYSSTNNKEKVSNRKLL